MYRKNMRITNRMDKTSEIIKGKVQTIVKLKGVRLIGLHGK